MQPGVSGCCIYSTARQHFIPEEAGSPEQTAGVNNGNLSKKLSP